MNAIFPNHARYPSLEIFHTQKMNLSKAGENHSPEISPCKNCHYKLFCWQVSSKQQPEKIYKILKEIGIFNIFYSSKPSLDGFEHSLKICLRKLSWCFFLTFAIPKT